MFPNGRGKNKPRETGSCVSHLRAGLPDPAEAVADCPSPRWRRRWVRDGGYCSCSCSWARCCSHAALSGAASASSCCTPRGPRRAGERAPAVGGGTAHPRNGDAVRWGKSWALGLGGPGISDLLGAPVPSTVDIEHSAGVMAMRGGSGLEEQWGWREVKGSQGSSPLFILTSLLTPPGSQEARHTSALPVLRHGGGRAVRELHVLRSEAALVCTGGRTPAGH